MTNLKWDKKIGDTGQVGPRIKIKIPLSTIWRWIKGKKNGNRKIFNGKFWRKNSDGDTGTS